MTTAELTFAPARSRDFPEWVKSIWARPERSAVSALEAPEHVKASLAEFGFLRAAE